MLVEHLPESPEDFWFAELPPITYQFGSSLSTNDTVTGLHISHMARHAQRNIQINQGN